MPKIESLITELDGKLLLNKLQCRLQLLENLYSRKSRNLNTLEHEIKAEMHQKADGEPSDQKKTKPVPGLRICKKGNSFQYYVVTDKGDTQGKYVSSKSRLIRLLASWNYSSDVMTSVKNEIDDLKQVVKVYRPADFLSQFESMHPGRRQFVTPFFEPDEEYAENWLKDKTSLTPASFHKENLIFQTAKGEKVRSKSEVLIADELSRAGVPYCYETPVFIESKGRSQTIYPDFTVLDVKNRRSFLWEHFGLMDIPEYSVRTVEKLGLYEDGGYFPGKNLIVTFETKSSPLTPAQIRGVIRQYFQALR